MASNTVFGLAIVSLLLLCSAFCAHAVTKTVTLNPGSTTAWSDANNWTPVGLPTTADDVVVEYSQNYQTAPLLDTAGVDATVNSLSLSDVTLVGGGRIRALGSTNIGFRVDLGNVNYDFEGPVTAIRLFSQAQAGSIINRSQMSTPLFSYAGSLFDNRGSVQFRSSEEFPTLFLSSASTFRNGGLLNVSVPSPTEFEIYGGTFLNLDSGVIRHNSITSLLFTTDSASTSTIGGQLLVPLVQFKQGSHAINCSSCPPFIGKTSAVLILDNTVPVPQLKVAGCTLRGSSALAYYAVDRLELESGTVDVFLNVSSLAATGSISLSKSLSVSKNASISGSITLTPSVELVILQNAVVSIPGLVDDCVGSNQCGKIKNYGSITLPDGGEMRTNTVNFGAVRLGTNPPYALDRCFLKNMGNIIPLVASPGAGSQCGRVRIGRSNRVFENRGRIETGFGWMGIAEFQGTLAFEAGSVLSGVENSTIRGIGCTIQFNSDLTVEGTVGFTVNAATTIEGPGRVIGGGLIFSGEWGGAIGSGAAWDVSIFTFAGIETFVSHFAKNITVTRFAQVTGDNTVIDPGFQFKIAAGAVLRGLSGFCWEGTVVNAGIFTSSPSPPSSGTFYGDSVRVCSQFINSGSIQLEHSDLSTGIVEYTSMSEWATEMVWDNTTLTSNSQLTLRVVGKETRVDRPCVDNFVRSNIKLAGQLSLVFERMPQNPSLPSTDYSVSVGDSWTIGVWGSSNEISGAFQTVTAFGPKLSSNLGVKLQFEQISEGLRLFAVACDKQSDASCGTVQPNPRNGPSGGAPSSGSNTAPSVVGSPRGSPTSAPAGKECKFGVLCSSAPNHSSVHLFLLSLLICTSYLLLI